MKFTKKDLERLRESTPVEYREDGRTISYSQYSMWVNCPLRWKLAYVDKLEPKEGRIPLIFGTAFHETLQEYLQTMFDSSIKKANQLDLNKMLFENMKNEVQSYKDKGIADVSTGELVEHYHDGALILDWFVKHRAGYFTNKQTKLLGIEQPIYMQAVDSNPNVMFVMYIDVALYNEKYEKVEIVDIKTSTRGWRDYQKKDKSKTDQVALYKHFYAKKFGVPEDMIKPYFFIVRRKVDENSMYPQRRVQIFEPSHGTSTLSRVRRNLQKFVDDCFNPDGSYNTEAEYPALSGIGEGNCRFCPFRDKMEHCDPRHRKQLMMSRP